LSEIEVRPLVPEDDRKNFRSGNDDLDRFFHRFAGQNQFKHHIGTTYVAATSEAILGFATVTVSHIEVDRIPNLRLRRRLPTYPLPVLRLARLAVSENSQGQGIGSALMRTIFHLAHELSRRVGCIGVVVDAKPEAIDYYKRLGFVQFDPIEGALLERPSPTPLFLPLSGIPE
jgi:GNAT superfamily N-acetyltransferase